MTPNSAAPNGGIRVLLVDDQVPFRALTRALLAADGQFDVVAEADNAVACLTAARHHRPHIVLVDLRLAGHDPGALIGPLIRTTPTTMIGVLSALPASRHRNRVRSLGAFAYYANTQFAELPALLAADHRAFARALDGEGTIAPAVYAR
ncbi:MAG: response regulator [Actinobacteria bacterium]|nr:response regulator [Actinomycetota bacterium]